MKKLFALVLCLMLALGCTAAFAEGETHTVYLITMDLFDAHWVGVDEGCQAAVAELAEQGININYVWNAPTQGKDDAAQIECIDNAYADNAGLQRPRHPGRHAGRVEQQRRDHHLRRLSRQL